MPENDKSQSQIQVAGVVIHLKSTLVGRKQEAGAIYLSFVIGDLSFIIFDLALCPFRPSDPLSLHPFALEFFQREYGLRTRMM